MSENSRIEWTDHTFNAWIGCTKVSAACDNCYAESIARRFFNTRWGHGEKRSATSEKNWAKPLAWNAKAARLGKRFRVFANSMSDVFDAEVNDVMRDHLFALVAMTPNLDWMVLTKRPKVMRDYFTLDRPAAETFPYGMPPLWHIGMAVNQPDWHDVRDLPFPNLFLGVTIENQKMADARIPLLLDTPAAKRFVSCEPLLGPVELDNVQVRRHEFQNCLSLEEWAGAEDSPEVRASVGGGSLIDLVIAGGESGPHARPSHPDWFRSLRDQCAVAGVPFHFKQWGDWAPYNFDEGRGDWFILFADGILDIPDDCAPDQARGEVAVRRVGKKVAGRLLDGSEHNGRIG